MVLTVSDRLLPVWQGWAPRRAPGAVLAGLAGAVVDGAASVVVAADPPVDPAACDDLAQALREALGADRIDVVPVPGGPVDRLVKQWVYQAAQGTGRGVIVTVRELADGGIDVGLRAIDSSARELVWRLHSDHEPDLPALRALFGARHVDVRDLEDGVDPAVPAHAADRRGVPQV